MISVDGLQRLATAVAPISVALMARTSADLRHTNVARVPSPSTDDSVSVPPIIADSVGTAEIDVAAPPGGAPGEPDRIALSPAQATVAERARTQVQGSIQRMLRGRDRFKLCECWIRYRSLDGLGVCSRPCSTIAWCRAQRRRPWSRCTGASLPRLRPPEDQRKHRRASVVVAAAAGTLATHCAGVGSPFRSTRALRGSEVRIEPVAKPEAALVVRTSASHQSGRPGK